MRSNLPPVVNLCGRIFLFLFLLSIEIPTALGETPKPSPKIEEEEKLEELKFQELKDVIKRDKLAKEAKKLLEQRQALKKTRSKLEMDRFFYPSEEDFWKMVTELWLTKNAVKLKWEFEKSDLGIGMAFKKVLEDLGIRNLSVRLLVLNSYEVPHMILPSKSEEAIFLLSLPFIREMDLSKVEISLLLIEDYWRWKNKLFFDQVTEKGYQKKLGTKMDPKKRDVVFVGKLLDSMSDFVFNVGYTFDQQYNVTKQMKDLLNTNKLYTKAYEALLKKRQEIVIKQNKFNDYSRRYPSPEMQLKWFSK
ncbi:MAG: hypothetical protein QE271_13210 [Bacteriovoracaceae bacterium]|nr:hypothetical protein [Bacteriovoracaceae bacterium]